MNRFKLTLIRGGGNLRLIFILVCIAGLLVASAAVVRAQDGAPKNINAPELQEQPPAAHPSDIQTVPPPPEGQEGLVAYTTNGEWIPLDSLGQPQSTQPEAVIQAAGITGAGGKNLVYLTNASFGTSATLTACAAGYHMASMWEILDISNLAYNYAHPAAHTKADSGFGPPAMWNGWVRTGNFSSGSAQTGLGNCLNWSSVDPANSGVSVRLINNWVPGTADLGVWEATSFTCNFSGPVWCVQD